MRFPQNNGTTFTSSPGKNHQHSGMRLNKLKNPSLREPRKMITGRYTLVTRVPENETIRLNYHGHRAALSGNTALHAATFPPFSVIRWAFIVTSLCFTDSERFARPFFYHLAPHFRSPGSLLQISFLRSQCLLTLLFQILMSFYFMASSLHRSQYIYFKVLIL